MFAVIKLNQMANNNKEFQYQNLVFDKFLETLFPLNIKGDKDDEDDEDNKNNTQPIHKESEEEETPLFI